MKGLQGIVFLLILIVIAPILLLFALIASLTEKKKDKSRARIQKVLSLLNALLSTRGLQNGELVSPHSPSFSRADR